jgi:hypothetical protein
MHEPAWSMESYRLRRAALLLRIEKSGDDQEIHRAPECAHCGTTKHLQVHHVEGNGDSHGIGGWKQLRKIEAEEKAGAYLGKLKDAAKKKAAKSTPLTKEETWQVLEAFEKIRKEGS